MTEIEVAKKILEQGDCNEVSCLADNCPAYRGNGFRGRCLGFAPRENEMPPTSSQGGLDSKGRKFFEDFLKSKEDKGMDKDDAIKRLDALDHEAAELRKIIEKGDKLVYDDTKMYVAIMNGIPYLLCGHEHNNYFSWHRFASASPAEHVWDSAEDNGQYALDSVKDYDIHVFADPREGMKFFYDQSMKAH
jgi:hypothetical protein